MCNGKRWRQAAGSGSPREVCAAVAKGVGGTWAFWVVVTYWIIQGMVWVDKNVVRVRYGKCHRRWPVDLAAADLTGARMQCCTGL